MASNIQSAKLAYLLASCHKFNDSFMTAMAKQYSTKVAMRYYFTLYITLCEPDDSDQFAVKDSHFEFDGSNEPVLKSAVQMHNNEVLSSEMKTIYDNLQTQNINLDLYQLVGVYAVAALVKAYNGREKYSFVPVVIDYGRSSNMVHQTALIVDHRRKTFMFYEPYGAYEKYGKSYRECIRKFFAIYTGVGLFLNGSPIDSSNGEKDEKSVIYHDLFGQSQGIQAIIMEKNNLYVDEFNAAYKKTLETLSDNFSEYGFGATPKMISEKLIVSDKDKNIRILDLLFQVEHLGAKPIPEDKKELYKTLLYESLEQFYWYNAKTCVSITLIEMNEFFAANVDSEGDVQANADRVARLYAEFDVGRPNQVLMQKLHSLIDIFGKSQDIRDTVNENMQSFAICKSLYTTTL